MHFQGRRIGRRGFLIGSAAGAAIALVGGRALLLRAAGSGNPGAPGAAPAAPIRVYSAAERGYVMVSRVVKSDAEWRSQLSPEQYEVTRRQGTEPAYTGKYWNHHDKGVYRCVCCGNDLFASETKYESGTGWPSFYEPIAAENVRARDDSSFFMKRTEIACSRCDAHLGHVFNDGPRPTGLRYCMNSAALEFVKRG